MSIWRCFIGTVLAAASVPTSCLDPAPVPPVPAPVVREQGPPERLLAATAQRVVLARVEYPAGTLADQVDAGQALPERLWVLAVDPATGERRWLENVFGAALRDVPVSDARWLAGITSDGVIWLADLDNGDTTRQLPIVEGVNPSTLLLAIRDPWLIVRDDAGPFAFQIQTHERVDLPAAMKSAPLAIFEGHIGYLLPGQAEQADLQVMDLLARQSLHVADVPADTPLFAQPGKLIYSEYNSAENAWFVRAYELTSGDISLEIRIGAAPQAGHSQFVVDVSPQGYLVVDRHLNELDYPIEEVVQILRVGERRFLHQYGVKLESASGQPRSAEPHLIFYNRFDGAWTFSNLEKLSSWRAFLFRNVQ